MRGVLAGAVLITLVGALDDRFDLHPLVKFVGQIAAATIPVVAGREVTNITLPFVGAVNLGDAAGPITVLGLVFVMNVVNFSDGIDGLAAGVCAISAVAFAIIAFDLGRGTAGDARRDHGRRGGRVPDLQLPAGARLHGGHRRDCCSACCSAA